MQLCFLEDGSQGELASTTTDVSALSPEGAVHPVLERSQQLCLISDSP